MTIGQILLGIVGFIGIAVVIPFAFLMIKDPELEWPESKIGEEDGE